MAFCPPKNVNGLFFNRHQACFGNVVARPSKNIMERIAVFLMTYEPDSILGWSTPPPAPFHNVLHFVFG